MQALSVVEDRIQRFTVRARPIDGQLGLAPVSTLFRNKKEIVRGIGYAQFLASMCRITGCGRLPSFGIEALNGCNPCEHAVAPTAPDREQQPRNGIRVR